MKSLKLLIVGLLFAASGAFAQEPVSAEQKAAVKELLDAMNFKQTMSQMIGAMSSQMPQMMDQMIEGASKDSRLSAEQQADARKIAKDAQTSAYAEMTDLFKEPQFLQGIEDIMSRAYGKNFSVEEIKAITAFYLSPAGKKLLQSQPQVMQQVMPEMMALMSPRVSAIMEKTTKSVIAQVEKKKSASGGAPK
jgi:uncharacterized protein